MEQERYRRSRATFEEFDTSLMYDDIEKIREREEEEEKDQNNKLSFAGMMALTAGAVLMVVGVLSGFFPASDLLQFLEPAMMVVGFGSLIYGFFKTLKLAFRQKELNFPALNVYRKTRPASNTNAGTKTSTNSYTGETRTRARTRNESTTRETTYGRSRAYQRRSSRYAKSRTTTGKKILTRSRSNRVFSGVAGGLAEYANISPALIRFAFIVGLFVPFPAAIFVYLLLSIILPANYEDIGTKTSGRSRRPTSFDSPSGS